MTKTHTAIVIGTNYPTEHLRDFSGEASLQFIGDQSPYQDTNQHVFLFGGKEYLLDIKEVRFTFEGTLVYGNLQDGENLGKIVLMLK
jgi:hypothetical protein